MRFGVVNTWFALRLQGKADGCGRLLRYTDVLLLFGRGVATRTLDQLPQRPEKQEAVYRFGVIQILVDVAPLH